MNEEEIVRSLFDGLLRRECDPEGLAAFSDALSKGLFEGVVTAILDSDEYSALKARVAPLRSSRRVGIVHIPKCAGSSLQGILSSNLDIYVGPRYFHRSALDSLSATSWGGESASVGDLARILTMNHSVMGHYSARVLIEAGATDLFLTLREPRARIISLYRFWQGLPKAVFAGEPALQRSLSMGFLRFLTSPASQAAVDNVIAAHILLETPIWTTNGIHSDNWQKLKPNFRMAVWPDQSLEVVSSIRSIFGLHRAPVDEQHRKNVTKKNHQEPERLSDEVVTIMQRYTRYDSEVIGMLMDEGLLSPRSQNELDSDFEAVALSHGFLV